ncbi:GNAT family N-acetyltransferase [Gluconacetobacter takamatsuzukensis]|uniref:GNAT family N-acetyltransferase n=1 Tax=Gluconacetobacter takamatsuzukensis TaxID=1286190 RepID=A0A7W4KF56_9PROT|nr:GNAT family N-acetyltransferase [Gluconacetobacter takamatsuzukensis]MBB2205786.1 GNAT family N-acetyltransferase [Gluconacetobacter takamatsuzukensis]
MPTAAPLPDPRPPHWRAMYAHDLPAVLDIAARVHPAYPEGEAVFAERLALSPAGCLVLNDGAGLQGYVLSHPWRTAAPPALDCALGALPARPDCWYLHDIALLPAARGRGAPAAALAILAAHAAGAGLSRIALIATGIAGAYWLRAGFTPLDQPEAAPILASYDPRARLMIRAVQPA